MFFDKPSQHTGLVEDILFSYFSVCIVDARFQDEDIASSLLYCITDQLAASAYLVAKCQGISNVVFCGSYIAGNPQIIQQIRTKLTNCSSFLKVGEK